MSAPPPPAGAGTVRRLSPADAEAFVVLRREALDRDPLAFAASIEDDRGLSVETVRADLADAQEHAIFGYFEDGELAGVVGLARDARRKRRHVATIWGMYVGSRGRRGGAGRALLAAAIDQGRRWPGVLQVELGVSETAEAARRLYESAGFRAWGREPRSLRWQGRFVDVAEMVLDLDAAAAGETGPLP